MITTEAGYHTDDRGNRWTAEVFTAEEAQTMSRTLVNCTGCVDCSRCTNCKNCTECMDCTHCVACTGCWSCYDCLGCTDCTRCNDCLGCVDCVDCAVMFECTESTDCEFCICCTACFYSSGLRDECHVEEADVALHVSAVSFTFEVVSSFTAYQG